jgi:hypothetical protein
MQSLNGSTGEQMADLKAALVACVLAGLAGLVPAAPARADHMPAIVIPSRPGVPVPIDGRDASYTVVEGDWGLWRPGAVPVTVIGGTRPLPTRAYQRRRAYHPKYGRAPPRGRNEVEPPPDRALPDPAESYSRSWSTSSDIVRPVRSPPPPPQRSSPDQAQAQSFDPPGIDPVPPTLNDPQPFNPTIEVVPRSHRRR